CPDDAGDGCACDEDAADVARRVRAVEGGVAHLLPGGAQQHVPLGVECFAAPRPGRVVAVRWYVAAAPWAFPGQTRRATRGAAVVAGDDDRVVGQHQDGTHFAAGAVCAVGDSSGDGETVFVPGWAGHSVASSSVTVGSSKPWW